MAEWTDWDDGTNDPRERVELALGLCGCSETDEVLGLVLEVLCLCERQDWNGVRERLHYAQDRAYYYIVLNWLEDHDVLEHGTAIRCAWPTAKGLAILRVLQQVLLAR